MPDDITAQLLLAQLADTAFPSGAFAHSYGLEQAVREGRITSPKELADFTRSILSFAVADSDAVAAAMTSRVVGARAAALPSLNPVLACDRTLYAMKAATELRHAATATGHRLLAEIDGYQPAPIVHAFAARVADGSTPGTHAVAFGLIAGSAGANPESVAAVFLQVTATGILQAALRLMRISHHDVQATLHDLRPHITQLAADAALPDRQLRAFHPAQEIAAMRHRTARMRLFAS